MGVSPKSRFTVEDTPANVKLDSWKEIAAYLDRDPRTVQLWEKLEGLPVHRLNHTARPSVYAFTAEIDAWYLARSGNEAPPPEPQSLPVTPPHPSHKVVPLAISAGAALFCLGLLTAHLVNARNHVAPAASPSPVLAVLPFGNQTSTDDAMADGMTESVIEDIDHMRKVRVIARQSVLAWKGSHAAVQEIAARLHASLLLRGTVAQTGGEIQVTVELLAAPGFKHLWGTTYKGKSTASGQVSDEIASAIAVDVTRTLTGSAPQAVLPAQSVDPRARQLFLAARFYWNQRDLASLQKAISLYTQALAIDPRYAEAYAGLAECYDLMTDRGVMSDQQAFERAKAAATTALSLDSKLAEAYNALAFAVYREDWDFARADQLFKKAVDLDPGSAVSHQWRGEFLGDMTRFDESIAELRTASELDPLSPMVGADLADGYMHAGRLAEADAELQRISDLYPDFLPAHIYRVGLAIRQRNLSRAESEAQVYFERSGDRHPLEEVQVLRLSAVGRVEQAKLVENRLLGQRSGSPLSAYSRAQFLFMMGRLEEGYAALEQAYREHSWWLVTMLVDPAFEGVREQPRFLDLARKVGLPVNSNPPLLARGPQSEQ
jgi:adenylate cyclase